MMTVFFVFAGSFDAFVTFLEAFLAAFFAAPDLAFELAFDFLPLAFFAGDRAGVGFADFSRVFLDIRLPFVAFSGSLTVIAAAFFCLHQNPVGGWANLTSAGYGDKRIYLVFGIGWTRATLQI